MGHRPENIMLSRLTRLLVSSSNMLSPMMRRFARSSPMPSTFRTTLGALRSRTRPFERAGQWSLWLFVASVPLDVWVVEKVGSISVVTGGLLVTVGLVAIVARARVRRHSAAHAFMALFVVWSVATFFWSRDPDATLQRALTNAQLLLFSIMFWQLSA